ncbi:hypothetical protein G6F66_015431 [Rhizopus arrhizus]|nr:hypothetical protein G6F66_015431 [Rhizopus arrhizus]
MLPISESSRQVASANGVRMVFLIHWSWPLCSLASCSRLACAQAAAKACTRAEIVPPSRSPNVSLAGLPRCSTAPSGALVALMKQRPPSTASRPKRASSAL